MSLGTTITFDDPRKFPPLLRLSQGVQRPDVRRVMGRAIAGALRRHFTKLDRERPNQLGGQRTHFYGQVRRGVQQPQLVGGDGVRVDTNHVGIAQRYFGGEIEAGQNGSGRHFLTLPVHPDAYGHRAREFEDLDFIPLARGRALLARPAEESTAGLGEVLYVLVRRVRQQPDPTVLPPEEELEETALTAGEDHLRTLIARTA
ncbi:MAG: hypothetical protein HZC55_04060 [Verrucomicrobia bacterium]|nr:hypothetical protein [Verrucomicrobiota bacterium]